MDVEQEAEADTHLTGKEAHAKLAQESRPSRCGFTFVCKTSFHASQWMAVSRCAVRLGAGSEGTTPSVGEVAVCTGGVLCTVREAAPAQREVVSSTVHSTSASSGQPCTAVGRSIEGGPCEDNSVSSPGEHQVQLRRKEISGEQRRQLKGCGVRTPPSLKEIPPMPTDHQELLAISGTHSSSRTMPLSRRLGASGAHAISWRHFCQATVVEVTGRWLLT